MSSSEVLRNDDTRATEALLATGGLIGEALLLYGPGLRLPTTKGSQYFVEKSLPLLRQGYMRAVDRLRLLGAKLLREGKSKEEVARILHRARREIGKNYKNITPPEMQETIFKRNLQRYRDKWGPSIDHL